MRSSFSARAAALLVVTWGFVAAGAPAPLLGAEVGNADALIAEGNRLYNAKDFEKAAGVFLKATRANPEALAAYLGYARSEFARKNLVRACYAYGAYLRAAPDGASERGRVEGELELCTRQRAAQKDAPPDPTAGYVEQKARFFSTLEEGALDGEGSAAEALRALVEAGYLAPDLRELAQRLHAAAIARAEDIYQRALAGRDVKVEELRSARRLYEAASQVGPALPTAQPHAAFAEAVAHLAEGAPGQADASLAEAIRLSPGVAEYKHLRAVALMRSGDNPAALRMLEAELPDDPRTHALRVVLAVGDSPEAGARELEKLLFEKRFQPGK